MERGAKVVVINLQKFIIRDALRLKY